MKKIDTSTGISPDQYARFAQRTQCDQAKTIKCIKDEGELVPITVIHGVLGLTGEAGELASAVEKWLYYGQGCDTANIKEELGDCLWYIAEICNAFNFSFQKVMEGNLRKLKERYPERYTDFHALEENRNRAVEMEAMEQTGQGWSESMEEDS